MRVFDDELIRRYTAAGHWDAMTLAQRIGTLAGADPDGLAFATEDERMTWGAYDRESTRLAAKLAAAGLSPGDRLGVLLPDGPAVHAAYVAAEKAGLVLVGIAPRSRVNEIAHLVDTSGCRALLTAPEHRGAPSAETVAGLRERGQRDRRAPDARRRVHPGARRPAHRPRGPARPSRRAAPWAPTTSSS